MGATINVRLPNRYYVTKSTTLAPQTTNESTVPLTLSTNYQVGLNFTQAELTLSLDDFSKRVLVPSMARLASQIDQDGLALVSNVFNQVGTPGTTPGTSGGSFANPLLNYNAPQVYLNAGMKMDNHGHAEGREPLVCPQPGGDGCIRRRIVGPLPGRQGHRRAVQEGRHRQRPGLRVRHGPERQHAHHRAHGGTPVVATGGQTGVNPQHVGLDASVTNILTAGEIISVAGVNGVNPENQTTTGYLQNFVVTANCSSDSSGNVAIPIYPSIVVAGAGVANGTVTASPAANAPITLMSGAASTSYPMNVAYHQDAFTLATADLEMPKGVDFAARETYDGVSMLIVRAYDINYAAVPVPDRRPWQAGPVYARSWPAGLPG